MRVNNFYFYIIFFALCCFLTYFFYNYSVYKNNNYVRENHRINYNIEIELYKEFEEGKEIVAPTTSEDNETYLEEDLRELIGNTSDFLSDYESIIKKEDYCIISVNNGDLNIKDCSNHILGIKIDQFLKSNTNFRNNVINRLDTKEKQLKLYYDFF